MGIDVLNPLASVTIFQYNPETMTRSLQAQTLGGGEEGKTLVRMAHLLGAARSELAKLERPLSELEVRG